MGEDTWEEPLWGRMGVKEKGVRGAAGREGSEPQQLGPLGMRSHGISVWRGCGIYAGNAAPPSPFFAPFLKT